LIIKNINLEFGKYGIGTVMRWMCEYNLQTNLNGLEQYIVCDLCAIVCIICSVVDRHRVNQRKIAPTIERPFWGQIVFWRKNTQKISRWFGFIWECCFL
jgi:hypothetical protein